MPSTPPARSLHAPAADGRQARRIPGKRPRSDLGGGHRGPQGCVGPRAAVTGALATRRPRSPPTLRAARRLLRGQAQGGRRRINEDRVYPSPTPTRTRDRFLPARPGARPGSPHTPQTRRFPLHPPPPSPCLSPAPARSLAPLAHRPHSSPISFSLTLGGKLAIYGAPSDSGGAMRAQRLRRERRALRGVTRDGSLPVPGTEGGAGAIAAASADCPGEAPEGLGPNYGTKHRQ